MGRHRGTRPKRITYRLMNRWGACINGLNKFHEAFPKGGEVTAKSVLKAVQERLGISWLIQCVVTEDQCDIYGRAWSRKNVAHTDRKMKIHDRTRSWKNTLANSTKIDKLIVANQVKWEKSQAALFMKAWRGTLFKKKGR